MAEQPNHEIVGENALPDLSAVRALNPKESQTSLPIANDRILMDATTLHFIDSVDDFLPNEFALLRNLRNLYIHKHRITEFPEQILELEGLKRLSLYDGLLVSIPETISRLRNLEDLNVEKNRLQYVSINGLNRLRKLSLHRNPDLNQLPEGLENTQFTKLSYDTENIQAPEYLRPPAFDVSIITYVRRT